jgi:hypothetical protein
MGTFYGDGMLVILRLLSYVIEKNLHRHVASPIGKRNTLQWLIEVRK